MIIILIIIIPFLWLKQKVPCQHFKNHASERPNISARIIRIPNNSLRRPVLSGLNLRSEMMMGPTSIPHVNYCYMTVFSQFRASFGLVYLRLLFLNILNRDLFLRLNNILFWLRICKLSSNSNEQSILFLLRKWEIVWR